eukprot:EG_transcript_11812
MQQQSVAEPIPPPRMHHNDYELYFPTEALDGGAKSNQDSNLEVKEPSAPQAPLPMAIREGTPPRPAPVRIFAVEPDGPPPAAPEAFSQPAPAPPVRPLSSIFAEAPPPLGPRPAFERSLDVPKPDGRDSIQHSTPDPPKDSCATRELAPRLKTLIPDLPESQEVNFPRTADVKQEIRAMKDEHEAHAKEVADLQLLTASARERTMQALLELRQLDCEHSILMHQLKVAESSADWFRRQRETLERVREAAARKKQRQPG